MTARKKAPCQKTKARKSRGKVPPGLKPAKPGEIRNPEGRNQYTYRREFEGHIQRLLSGEMSPALSKLIPPDVQEIIKGRDDVTAGEVIALVTIARGVDGDLRHLPELLKRLWPATTIVANDPDNPVTTPDKPDLSKLTPKELRELGRLHAKLGRD